MTPTKASSSLLDSRCPKQTERKKKRKKEEETPYLIPTAPPFSFTPKPKASTYTTNPNPLYIFFYRVTSEI
jgi:hypothetical protein